MPKEHPPKTFRPLTFRVLFTGGPKLRLGPPIFPASCSKERDLDVQEFLRILPEIPDKQPHVSGQLRKIVVQLRVGKHFAGRGRIFI